MAHSSFLKLAALGMVSSSAFAAPSASRSTSSCPVFSGSFSIDNMQLYPENADWDPVHCKLYLSSLFNDTVMVYDPYTTAYDIITFDGVTGNDVYHVSGIDFDPYTGTMSFIMNSGAVFNSGGVIMATGPDKLARYDTATNTTVFTADLASIEAKTKQEIGIYADGPQDVATDPQGNSYVPFTYGTVSIAKISPLGESSLWYAVNETGTTDSQNAVLGGLVYHEATRKLIICNAARGTFVTLDTTSETAPVQTDVAITGWTSDYKAVSCDGLYSPARYGGNVLLCSENDIEANTIFATADDWTTGRYIGQVSNKVSATNGGVPVATVQITDSIFSITEWFSDEGAPPRAGNRSVFPILDYTSEIDAIVSNAGFAVLA